jgi:hypothetical protein
MVWIDSFRKKRKSQTARPGGKEKLKNGEIHMTCHHCGFEVSAVRKIGRQETCAKCGLYLHCCLNCRFYAENANRQCREEQAEFVSDKRAANFCDYFEPAKSGAGRNTASNEDARRKLEQLFKKNSGNIERI